MSAEVTGEPRRRQTLGHRSRGRRRRRGAGRHRPAGVGPGASGRDSAHGRRQAGPERHLAGAQHRQLRHRGAHGAPGAGDAAGPGRAGAGQGGAGVRRRRRGARGHRHRRGRRDSVPARGARRSRTRTRRTGSTRDPEIKCYLPGVPRANYMPFPFQILQSDKAAFFIAYEYAGAVRNIYLKDPGPAAGRFVDGPVGRRAGRATRSSSTVTGFNDQTLVRSRRQPSQRQAEGHRALHADRARSHPVRSDDRRSEDVHAAVEDAHAALSPHESPTRGSISSSASSSSKS